MATGGHVKDPDHFIEGCEASFRMSFDPSSMILFQADPDSIYDSFKTGADAQWLG